MEMIASAEIDTIPENFASDSLSLCSAALICSMSVQVPNHLMISPFASSSGTPRINHHR